MPALLDIFFAGAVSALAWVAGLLFLRYFRKTGDQLFIYFAFSFFIQGCARAIAAIWFSSEDTRTPIYVLRLISYGLIIFAIIQKNVARRRNRAAAPPPSSVK